MMVMLAMSVAPAAFAHDVACTGKFAAVVASFDPAADEDGDGIICARNTKQGFQIKDDHGFLGH